MGRQQRQAQEDQARRRQTSQDYESNAHSKCLYRSMLLLRGCRIRNDAWLVIRIGRGVCKAGTNKEFGWRLTEGHMDGYEGTLMDNKQRFVGMSGDHGANVFLFVLKILIGNEVLSAHHILTSIKILYIE